MKRRSLGKMFALFIVTIGIYRLYWFAKTRNEMMSISKVKIPSVWIFVLPLIVVFMSLIAMVVASADTGNSAVANLFVAIFYLAFFAMFCATAWWLWYYCKAVEDITHEKMHFGVAILITLVVPDGIDMLILQDTFNKVADQDHLSTSVMAV